MIFLQGHGITHNNDSILMVPELKQSETGSSENVLFLNVTNMCKKFASLKRCLTVVFLDACRENSTKYQNLIEEN